MADFADRYWTSADGIKLHYRDYAGPHERPPILCLPGLTRNARDFEPVADRCAGQWRVIAVDLRGRGGSGYDPDPANYNPSVYVTDVLKMLDQLGIADAVGGADPAEPRPHPHRQLPAAGISVRYRRADGADAILPDVYLR